MRYAESKHVSSIFIKISPFNECCSMAEIYGLRVWPHRLTRTGRQGQQLLDCHPAKQQSNPDRVVTFPGYFQNRRSWQLAD